MLTIKDLKQQGFKVTPDEARELHSPISQAAQHGGEINVIFHAIGIPVNPLTEYYKELANKNRELREEVIKLKVGTPSTVILQQHEHADLLTKAQLLKDLLAKDNKAIGVSKESLGDSKPTLTIEYDPAENKSFEAASEIHIAKVAELNPKVKRPYSRRPQA